MRLKGKVVIIASESSMRHDTNLTPYARGFLPLGGRMTSGAELHANIVETCSLARGHGRFLHYCVWVPWL